MPNPWDRRLGDDGNPKESDPSWQAFVLFRDMGPDRTLAKVAKQLGKSATLIERWSARHEWQRRAALWDAHEDQAKQEARLDEVRDMEQRHRRVAQLMQQKSLQKLQNLDPEQLSPTQAIQMMELAVKMERQAMGEPTEILADAGAVKGSIPPDLTEDGRAAVIDLARTIREKRVRSA